MPLSFVVAAAQQPLALLVGHDTLVVLVPREFTDRAHLEQQHRDRATEVEDRMQGGEAARSRRRLIEDLLAP